MPLAVGQKLLQWDRADLPGQIPYGDGVRSDLPGRLFLTVSPVAVSRREGEVGGGSRGLGTKGATFTGLDLVGPSGADSG